MIITSERKFGVEIEFYAPTERKYVEIRRKINVVRDGSLDGRVNGGEFVSGILKGLEGEKEIIKSCSVLNKFGADTDDERTSLHIHLDGKKNGLEISEVNPNEPQINRIYGVSNRLIRDLSKDELLSLLYNGIPFGSRIVRSDVDNIVYYGYSERTTKPIINYKYFTCSKVDRFKWIRNVFLFYVQYSDILESMVSNSRKFGNMYCIPLGSAFSVDDITACNDIGQLMTVWYKGQGPGGHYDNSRYYSTNLHSFFADKGTVEIRSHGGTTDPYKILMWLRFHQYIVDKLENMTMAEVKANPDLPLEQNFIDFLSDDPVLVDYAKRLTGYFSGVRI